MNKKTPDIGAEARLQIAATLPNAIETAIESYHTFMASAQEVDQSKEFKDRHTAAKAALAHIELLLKLAATVDMVDNDKADHLCAMLKTAQEELDRNDA